jgi:ATP-dependent Clp protease ATP-binding subunit ClpC
LGHSYVGSEHILLVLLRSGDPGVDAVIRRHGLRADAVRERLESVLPAGSPAGVSGASEFPYTSRAKRVIELACSGIGDTEGGQVGARAFLEAIVGDARNVAAAVLHELGFPGRQPQPTPMDALRERVERAGLHWGR